MTALFASAILALTVNPTAQGHDVKPADALQQIAFLAGDWKRKQEFNTQGGAAMVGDITVKATQAVGNRFIEELLSTTLPNRKPTDSRHYIGFDPKAQKYKAWWFNDTSNVPMQLEGSLDGNKFILLTSPNPDGTPAARTLRATYEKVSDSELNYTLEMQTPDGWQALFHNHLKK